MRRLAGAALIVAAVALLDVPARGASSAPPSEFAGVALGTSLKDLKQQHPEVRRNPDSDRQFQVYQALSLKGLGVNNPVAFDIYNGRVVGGQVMLDSYTARYWYDQMVARYGDPDSCTYCGDAELASASWMWHNGERLHIGGGMLTILTEEGASQRQQWIARGDTSASEDKGDEESDLGEPPPQPVAHPRRVRKKINPPRKVVNEDHPAGWRAYYEDAKTRVARWFGWSK